MHPRALLLSAVVPIAALAVAAPAAATDSPPDTTTPAVPAEPAVATSKDPAVGPADSASAPGELGVAAPSPEVIDSLAATGLEDVPGSLTRYGFDRLGAFPAINNAVLYQLDGRVDLGASGEGGDASHAAWFVVSAPQTELQRFNDTVVAALGLDSSQYESTPSSGTNGDVTYVGTSLEPLEWDGPLPAWEVDVSHQPEFGDAVVIKVSRRFNVLPEAVPLTAGIAEAHSVTLATASGAGLAEPFEHTFIVGINSIGGFPINTADFYYTMPGDPAAMADTVCAAFGFAVDASDPEQISCRSESGVKPRISIYVSPDPVVDGNARVNLSADTDETP